MQRRLTIDSLPHSVLLEILSRLDDSADVARCRVASKAFDSVFPGLRSIHLRCSPEWYDRASISPRIKPFKTVFLDLISKQETVESVFVDIHVPRGSRDDDFSITDGDVAKEWLPRVSASLRSLSIHDFSSHRESILISNILPLLSAYCHNLVNLKLRCAWLAMHNMNPMPMLTSLVLEFTRLEDKHLNEFNRCFPNIRYLQLKNVKGLVEPKIHLLHLRVFHWDVYEMEFLQSLTLIAPRLFALQMVFFLPAANAIHIEAPMLSHFHVNIRFLHYFEGASFQNKFENLRTLKLTSFYIVYFLSQFPITKTVEDLTLYSENRATVGEYTLGKVFELFPNVTCLRINSVVWWDLEACLNTEGCEILVGRNRLKKIHANLRLYDPSLTFSFVARVLDQCVRLSKVSLVIHGDVAGTVSKRFMSKCMARWPRLKWRWGTWSGLTDIANP